VTLGEGNTPLVRADKLAHRLGMEALYVKLEGTNPTGTFKDRAASVAVTKAIEEDYTDLAIASAGNAGAAASAYAARAGLQCWVFVPAHTPRERMTQIAIAGANIIAVEGSVNDCSDLVDFGMDQFGWCPVTTAAKKNLYQNEGLRTIAFEVWQQLDQQVPDWVVSPVGGGGILSATAKGWRELQAWGLTDCIPRLVAVQADGCAPLVRAVLAGVQPDKIQRWEQPTSIVWSIADPFPMDGARAMRALAIHGGHALEVSDEETVDAERALAHDEGIFIEPASATTLAALKHLLSDKKISHDETVVVLATGIGFKDMATATSLVDDVPTIEASRDAMIKSVEEAANAQRKG
jgi:threonine synthase